MYRMSVQKDQSQKFAKLVSACSDQSVVQPAHNFMLCIRNACSLQERPIAMRLPNLLRATWDSLHQLAN